MEPSVSGDVSFPRRIRRGKHQQVLLGPGDKIAEGDSSIAYDLPLPDNAFELLKTEVRWQKMYHRGGEVPRLVAVQGEVDMSDGSVPIYRHPADEAPSLAPYTPTVLQIGRVAEEYVGHPLNHVLIQFYRSGYDSISEHSDKTLDIIRGSKICNVSLGAQRTMYLRTKKADRDGVSANRESSQVQHSARQIQRVPMPHNSLFVLGPRSNNRWLHAINPDKRSPAIKSPAELEFGGMRISLTFRQIGTFMNPTTNEIWGQGATSKARHGAGQILYGDEKEVAHLLHAFSTENHATNLDWDAVYGNGFDVVNFETIKPCSLKLTLSGNEVSDMRIIMAMLEFGVGYELVKRRETSSTAGESRSLAAKQERENAKGHTQSFVLQEDGLQVALCETELLLRILEKSRPNDATLTQEDVSEVINGANQVMLEAATSSPASPPSLEHYETYFRISKHAFMDGDAFGIKDCIVWPALRAVLEGTKKSTRQLKLELQAPAVRSYYEKISKRHYTRHTLQELDYEV